MTENPFPKANQIDLMRWLADRRDWSCGGCVAFTPDPAEWSAMLRVIERALLTYVSKDIPVEIRMRDLAESLEFLSRYNDV